MSTITVQTTRHGSRVTFRVTGDLDYRNDEVVLSAVRAELLDASVVDVDLDLTELGFCDSTGLGALITIRSLAFDRGMMLSLLGPQASLIRLLEMTGLNTYFAIEPAPIGPGPAAAEEDRPPLPLS